MANTYLKAVQFRELSGDELAMIDEIMVKAAELEDVLGTDPSRELSLARTKLEECVMWAVKAVAK